MVSGFMTVALEFIGFCLIVGGGVKLVISSAVEEAKLQLEKEGVPMQMLKQYF